MTKILLAMLMAAVALLVSCSDDGGDDTSADETVSDSTSGNDDSGGSDGGGESSGDVVDPAPAGQATASVDGLDLTFGEVLAGGCSISGDAISYGFAADDGVTTLAAGINHDDGDWLGSMNIQVPNPEGEGLILYSPAPAEGATLESGSVSVDGSSMSYSGPMLKQPPNDGSNPPPVDVGDGTISATC